jgi:hypothetical protein
MPALQHLAYTPYYCAGEVADAARGSHIRTESRGSHGSDYEEYAFTSGKFR